MSLGAGREEKEFFVLFLENKNATSDCDELVPETMETGDSITKKTMLISIRA